jgi:glycosyltransferase involved in cell wall biosynthesis
MQATDSVCISVITVTFNNLAGLQKTIHSINKQTCRDNIQWVCIDGGSSDGSLDFIKQQIHSQDFFCSEKDKGLYDAMNKGIAASKGGFVWFLNAGDTFFSNETVADCLKNCHSADLLYGETMLVTEEHIQVATRSKSTSRKLPGLLNFKSLLGGMLVNHQSILLRKSFCPNFDLSYAIAADYDWLCRVLKQNPRTYNTNQILSNFELGGLSSQKVKKSWKERFRIMCSHFGLFQTLIAHIWILFRALIHKIK